MKIAYLINQYPIVSHSFIRREILALEELKIPIVRFSHRCCANKIVDDIDRAELEKTNVILKRGKIGLLVDLALVALSRPKRWFRALGLALRLGWLSNGWIPDKGLLRHCVYLAEACVLLSWLSRLEIDHVHAHFGTYSTTVALLCHTLGGPAYSFTVHGPEEFDNVRGMGMIEKIRRANFIIAVSSFGRGQLYRWCDYREWEKIHIVRCGLDRDFFSGPLRSIAPEARFLCIARLSEQKGHFVLIEAVHQLVREGITLKLVLVGDGSLREEITRAIAEKGLGNTIEMIGPATEAEVKNQILRSRAMVLPSFAEGLPVVIMESLALGRPVISTHTAGIPELLESGVTGWLVPAGEVEALASTMRMVLNTPVSELEAMGRRGRERVAEKHDIYKEAKKLAHLFTSSTINNTETSNKVR